MHEKTAFATWQDRCLIAVAIALVAIPAVILWLGAKPDRYGFQMYSGYGDVNVTWVDTRGESREVDLGDHVAVARGDIDWTDSLPEQLCDRIEGAVRVEVRRSRPGEDQVRSVAC